MKNVCLEIMSGHRWDFIKNDWPQSNNQLLFAALEMCTCMREFELDENDFKSLQVSIRV